jgi:hypothetical protein
MTCLVQPSFGGPLTDSDYERLQASWITREFANQALLRRVSSAEGAQITGRKDNGSYEGILFPYVWPGEDRVREYRLRRDRPEIQFDSEGRRHEKNKYLAPPGRGSLLYCMPGTRSEPLADPHIPIAITEGEKKTIALHRLAWHEVGESVEIPRFLPVGLGGVWSFTGKIGKVVGSDGSPRDEKGLIPDLERVVWSRRRVYVVYDSNVHTNPKVAAARRALTGELSQRGAQVLWVNLPLPNEGSRD